MKASRLLLPLLACALSACVPAASYNLVLDATAVRDAPPATLVRILNDANAEPKAANNFFSGIPCKEFTETHATVRNHQFGSVKEVPYGALTFSLVSDKVGIAAQVIQAGAVGMNCTILVYPPSASGELSPAQKEAVSRVALALRVLGAQMAPGIVTI